MTTTRILIVENDPNLLKLYAKVLMLAGYTVHEAVNVEIALEMLERYPFAVCVCDIIMDRHSGLDLLTQLMLLETDGTSLIMISGWDQYRSLCEAFGVPFYLKPISMRDLRTIVQNHLGDPVTYDNDATA